MPKQQKATKHTYGLVHDRHDDRDMNLSASIQMAIHLPPKVDLRPKCSPVRDQGNLGSCTGFAIIAGFRECLLIQSGKPFVELSPLYEYYWERVKERTVDTDAGAQIRDGMKVLSKFGAAPETDWPYNIAKFKDKPSDAAQADARLYAIQAYHRVRNATEVKQALVNSHPVVIGIEVWDSFESKTVAQTGEVPIPDFSKETNLGGHAVCVVGYDDAAGKFLVKNSWGTSWGMGGYFTLPYGFFNPNLNLVLDMWTGRA